MSYGFPIVYEAPLGAPPRRLMGFIPARRTGLPAQPPGTVLVFDTGKKWVSARGRLSGTESFVVGALSVSIVQMRPRIIVAEIKIPSSSVADDFTVQARFSCRVTRPELVAEHGPIDVEELLGQFLREDRGLHTKGQETRIEDVAQIRVKVNARVRAYCDEVNPDIPGVDAKLSSVDVLSPEELREHVAKMRTATWAHDLNQLLAHHEDEAVRRIAAMLDRPENVGALGLVRGEIDVRYLANSVYGDRATKDANILEFLKVLERNGQLDRLPINGQILVDTLMQRLSGLEAGAGAPHLESSPSGPGLPMDAGMIQSIENMPTSVTSGDSFTPRAAEGEDLVLNDDTD